MAQDTDISIQAPVAQPQSAAQMMAPAGPGGALAPIQKPRARRSIRSLIFPAIVLAGVAYGGSKAYEWFVEGRFLVSTDDAYVGADTAIIAAKISGHVALVAAAANSQVLAGDVLVKIDDGDYRIAVAAAKAKIATQDATIARIGQQVEAQRAVIAQTQAQADAARAQLESSQADRERAALEYDRSQKLAATSFGSQQRLEQAAADRARTAASLAGAGASLAGAQAAQSGAKANLEVLAAQKVEAERTRGELETALAKAERDLGFATITAPFDGVVGNRAAELGEYVQPGTRLLALVPLASAYVDANFKETQLGAIRPGQKVDVAVDSLDGRVIEGVVTSVAPASGSQFSLLPPDNATGNFTKVVQRVAVRIALPADALAKGDLRPGLSVVASVRTRDEALPRPTLLGALGFDASAKAAKTAGANAP
ncbi:MAG: HlyD family secretion protein [Roseiarcus sp.]|jgi:membrane fusion protein (multidrug efflux system)